MIYWPVGNLHITWLLLSIVPIIFKVIIAILIILILIIIMVFVIILILIILIIIILITTMPFIAETSAAKLAIASWFLATSAYLHISR